MSRNNKSKRVRAQKIQNGERHRFIIAAKVAKHAPKSIRKTRREK